MERIEREIIRMLQKNARISNEEMADILGCSADLVAETIHRLEEERILLKYTAVVDEDQINRLTNHEPQAIALIEVRISPMRERGFDSIAKRIYLYDEVDSVYLMSGAYDLMVLMKGDSMRQVAYFVYQKLATIDGVLSTATHFILKKYKEAGMLFEQEEIETWLPVTP